MLIAPVLFWAGYHYYRDRQPREPFHRLITLFALGVVAGFVSNLAYVLLSAYADVPDRHVLATQDSRALLAYSLGVIGALEELGKFLVFYLVAVRHARFHQRLDGVIYAACVALGFATFENTYALQVPGGAEALGRAIASPLVQVMFAALWGYLIGRAILAGRPLWPATVTGLVLAIILHGLFEFFLFGHSSWIRLGPPLLIGAVVLWRMRLSLRARTAPAGEESPD